VMMYVRYPLSLRQVEDLLSERDIDICHETVRLVEPVRPDVRRGDPETARSKPFVFSLALAPGRGLREDQWRNALPLAGCRSRRRSAGILCHQTSRPQGCLGFSEESVEALRFTKGDRHRPSSIISGCDGSIVKCKVPGNRSMAKQPRGKFSPAFSTKRICNATLSPREDPSEICLRIFRSLQSLQPRKTSHLTRRL